MLRFISVKIFIIALSIGLFLNYLTIPKPNITYLSNT